MKARLTNTLWCLAIAGLALSAFNEQSPAQTSAILGVRMAGGLPQLSLSGPTGSSWTILYSSELPPAAMWTPLTNVTLMSTPTVVADPNRPLDVTRYYRALLLQGVSPTNVVVTNMIWMPPGTFVMGSPSSEVGRQPDEVQHTVTLTQGFFIGKYLVTQGDYAAVAGVNPSWFNGLRNGTDYGTDLSRPVENLYWFSAESYCAQLTQLEQQSGRLPTNWVYRLPTEAEWEYACRAGTTNRFSYGEDPGYVGLPSYAWFLDNSSNVTHEVGLKLANPASLYDVHGNVYEWCQDYYGDYPTGPITDPQGPTSGAARVFRGGSWQYGGAACRSAGRYPTDPATKFNFLGFRVVVAPK